VQVRETRDGPGDALREPAVPWSGEPEVMEPLLIVAEPETERWVEIRDDQGRVITVIEVLSPANKSRAGLGAYRDKRSRLLQGGANVVEIDLLREGHNALDLPWNLRTPSPETAYRTCVRRPTHPDRVELYLLPLRRRLPGILIPLRESDGDVVLDLQALVDRAFEDGGYAALEVTRNPEPPLAPEDAHWLDQCLRQAGLRK